MCLEFINPINSINNKSYVCTKICGKFNIDNEFAWLLFLLLLLLPYSSYGGSSTVLTFFLELKYSVNFGENKLQQLGTS